MIDQTVSRIPGMPRYGCVKQERWPKDPRLFEINKRTLASRSVFLFVVMFYTLPVVTFLTCFIAHSWIYSAAICWEPPCGMHEARTWDEQSRACSEEGRQSKMAALMPRSARSEDTEQSRAMDQVPHELRERVTHAAWAWSPSGGMPCGAVWPMKHWQPARLPHNSVMLLSMAKVRFLVVSSAFLPSASFTALPNPSSISLNKLSPDFS